jgi:D-threo-aldose 1-dehydrogenase
MTFELPIEHIMNNLPQVPRVTLGRSGIVSSRLGLGCAYWPHHQPYETVVEVFRTAFAAGISHIDAAALYGTEEVVGRALKDAQPPADMVMVTKACSEGEDGRYIQEYTENRVMHSVERSLKRLQVERLDILHIHDARPEDLPQVFARNGALRAMLRLKSEGVIKSIGMATSSLTCLKAAIECGEIDHIQPFHSYTLLNQEAQKEVIPWAKAKKLSILNNAPYAGYILLTGPTPDALYNYRPAPSEVMEAVRRIEAVCAQKGAALGTAALAFSLLDPRVDATVIGASTPDKLLERVAVFHAPLAQGDFEEMKAAAGRSFPISTV